MKLIGIDRQVERLAMKWYLKEYFGDDLRMADKDQKREIIQEVKEHVDSKYLVKRYFETHPKMKQQYKEKKQQINKIKTMAGMGLLTVALGTGAAYRLSGNQARVGQPKQPAIEIDYDEQNNTKEVENAEQVQQQNEDDKYTEFFDTISNMNNTEQRDKEIVQFTKERIADAYNQEHEEKISAERLQYLHLHEYVIAHKDKFGNVVSFERVPVSEREDVEINESQDLIQLLGGIYEFKVDGKTVAVYERGGQEIVDKNIDQKDDFFKNTLGIVDEAISLQDIYKYKSNDHEKKQENEEYKEKAQKLLQPKAIEQQGQELNI